MWNMPDGSGVAFSRWCEECDIQETFLECIDSDNRELSGLVMPVLEQKGYQFESLAEAYEHAQEKADDFVEDVLNSKFLEIWNRPASYYYA